LKSGQSSGRPDDVRNRFKIRFLTLSVNILGTLRLLDVRGPMGSQIYFCLLRRNHLGECESQPATEEKCVTARVALWHQQKHSGAIFNLWSVPIACPSPPSYAMCMARARTPHGEAGEICRKGLPRKRQRFMAMEARKRLRVCCRMWCRQRGGVNQRENAVINVGTEVATSVNTLNEKAEPRWIVQRLPIMRRLVWGSLTEAVLIMSRAGKLWVETSVTTIRV